MTFSHITTFWKLEKCGETMKVYECDCCKKVIQNPYELKMKEFYVGCSFEPWGVFPSNDKRKVKINLCDDCFKGLNKIAKDKAVED